MIDLIKQALESPAGSFGFVFAILILGFWIVHWVTKNVTKIKSEHGGLNKTVEKIENNIDEIRKDLSYLKGNFEIFKKGIPTFAKSRSPISLTEIGIETAKELNVENMIIRNWENIYKNLEQNISNKNAYDIQEYCFYNSAVELDKFISNEDIDFLKKYAYKQGNPLQYYSIIFGILIRDKYLSIKGIDVSEIDENDPNAK